MNSDMAPNYFKEELDFDMMKQFQQPANNSASGNVFGHVWGTDGGFSNVTYTPGEYLNDKEATYEAGFIDPQATGEFMEWSSNTPSMLNSPMSASISETPSVYNDLLSPTTVTNPPATWSRDAFENSGMPFTGIDDAAVSSSAANAATSTSTSSHSKSKVSKGKSKSTHSKSRSRSEVKSKSISSASSASSAGSVKYANSGHGGNHHITLRTASRKPKPAPSKPQAADGGSLSPESTPSSPDATTDPLTNEERRARQNHNVVEKQYRNRLNAQFEWLLAVLPANQPDGPDGSRHGEFDDRRMSKAEVLDLARRRIHALEQERKQLHAERKTLLENVSLMQRAVQRQHLAAVGGNAV